MTDNQPQPWPDIDSSLAAVAVALDTANLSTLTDGTIAELGRRYDLALEAKKVLTQIVSELDLALAETMDEDMMAVTGVGMLVRKERKGSASWKDEHAAERLRDDLIASISSHVALDVATGEVDPLKRNIARAAATEAVDAFGKSGLGSVLTSAQKKHRVWMSEYKTTSASSYHVTVQSGVEDDR